MAKQAQLSAEWVNKEDQQWLGRWARQWATDPKNKFCDPAKPNGMDRQFLSLFDAIEACAGDIDERLDELHQTWKHSYFLTKSLYRVKAHYLFRGVGFEVAARAAQLKTDSAAQMNMNWNRVQNIYNGQDGSMRAAKAWIGPLNGAPTTGTPGRDATSNPAVVERYRGGRYYSAGGSVYEGPLVDLVVYINRAWRRRRARGAALAAVESPRVEPDRTDGAGMRTGLLDFAAADPATEGRTADRAVRNNLAAFLVSVSLLLYVASMVYGVLNRSFFGVSSTFFFGAATILLTLTLFVRPRR